MPPANESADPSDCSGRLPPSVAAPLGEEEYIEQAHFFGVMAERMREQVPAQEVLQSVREEVLATTKLPMAIDFLLAELRHAGQFHTAMQKLAHYFTPFQSFVIAEAENDRGKFDFRIGLTILQREANYRAGRQAPAGPTPQGLFLYQFEVLCRNRLGYQPGLTAVAGDPAYDATWREWILQLRHQIGMVDFADLLYLNSALHQQRTQRQPRSQPHERADEQPHAPLFGDREGRIALANRGKDPLFLFASLHRQLGYPKVPRPVVEKRAEDQIGSLAARLEQLEKRMRLVEEEQRGGIDLTQLYERPEQENI